MNEEFVIDIIEARALGGYRIELRFSDGIKKIIDFGLFLEKSSHPDIRKYLDQKEFEKFTIESGDLVWNDYELCFPLGDLYEGMI